jgi:tellurite resistance protein
MAESSIPASLFSELAISRDEALLIAAALQDIASVDGTHSDEKQLIQRLLRELGAGSLDALPLDTLELPPMSPDELAPRLLDPTLRMALLQCSLLLAMADGKVSPAERERILEYARALGVSPVACEELESVIEGWIRSGEIPIAPLATGD